MAEVNVNSVCVENEFKMAEKIDICKTEVVRQLKIELCQQEIVKSPSTFVAEGLASLTANPVVPGSISGQDELPGSVYRRPPVTTDSLDRPPWNVVKRRWMASAMAPEADLLGGGVSPRTDRGALGEVAEAGMAKASTRSSYLLAWPLNSPDLTPPDFFVWGFVKDIVYSQKPRNIDELRIKITQAFQQTTPLMLQRTWAELHHRYELCRVRNGGHVEL
ncbi:hypothetical protein ANN_11352 [Periplaneta americana]|uniref:Uncharacterized protein n=1 Tax=Periplaneta americana TaxID=6978 RepID=A0ABQ8T669_PERAM|nr:hypothetical protein ANN_11352 [Periplaneta americana]